MTARLAGYGVLAACLAGIAFLLTGAARHAGSEFSDEALASSRPAYATSSLHLRRTVAAMSLEQKIGQMMMVSIPAAELSDETAAWLASHHIGGIILLGKNVRDRAQTISLIHDVQDRGRAADAPALFIAADQEGGAISRFRFLDEMRSQQSLGDGEAAYAAAKRRGKELKALGVNVNFSPVMDIALSADDFIADRTFRGDASTVASLGASMIRGYRDAGVIAVPKHFPGHGETIVDSHRTLPTVARNVPEQDPHLLPFREAIATGARMLMTGHIFSPKTDPEYPASISRIFSRMLREDLGYGGVVITDDLAMGAIRGTHTPPDAAVRAATAGADILLVVDAPQMYNKVYDALLSAARESVLDVSAIDTSVMRILTLKKAFLGPQ